MQLHAFRRTFVVAAVWVAAIGALLVAPQSASGQEAVQPGRGSAFAQGVKVDPRSGRLSFGITYGLALAGHQNNVAIAEARSADLGLIGSTLAGEGCDGGDPTFPKEDQPQPLVSRSNEEGSGQEQVNAENGVERRVLATSDPLARAVATTAAAGEAAVLQIGGTQSRTESGVVDGARLARAVTEVSRVAFAGGQVVLKGMRWEAVFQTAPTQLAEGSFTIDGIEVAGQSLPVPAGDGVAALGQANAVLEPLGFKISPPVVRNEAGIQFVDPMRIGVVPSTIRESVLGPVFNGAQPVRESVFDAIIEADCSNAGYLTVLDIVLGSVTGAGSLSLELGGVTASSADIARTSFLGGLGGAPSLSPRPQGSAGGATGSLGTTSGRTGSLGGSTGGTSVGTVTPPPAGSATTGGGDAAGGDDDEQAVADVEPLSGSRGGALAGVGLGGLALLAALAGADRHKMRKAQRTLTMEAF